MEAKHLDMRPVEPKDRLETILGTWEKMRSGEDLMLTVDHDPMCMYYTLVEDYGEGTFEFNYLEKGPEVWKVKVHKK